MPELISFGQQVTLVMLVRLDLNWNHFHDFQTISDESCALLWVVCHELHFAYAKVPKNLCANAIIALIRIKTELDICFNCIQTFLLEFVCFEFVKQAYTPALLVH